MTAVRVHTVALDGSAASCAPCRWGYTDPDDDARARAVARHVGVPVAARRLRAPGCHSVCIGEDRCMLDGDGGGD